MREFRLPASLFQKASFIRRIALDREKYLCICRCISVFFVLVFVQWSVSSGGLHWIGAALQPHKLSTPLSFTFSLFHTKLLNFLAFN